MKIHFLLCLVALLSVKTLYGQAPEVGIVDFMKDIQQWNKKDKKMSLSWWIPNEYWEIALADNKQVPPGTLEHIRTVMNDYILICAADLTINLSGSVDGTEESELRATLILYDETGKAHQPLTEDEISSEANILAATLKPLFAQAIGEMGKSMYLFFFSVQDEKKNNLISATKKGSFKIAHSDSEFLWNLPLPTLLPPKFCTVDKQKMAGNWSFCPFHGTKLDK